MSAPVLLPGHSLDLGWCEVCEERPASQRARWVKARICADCAEVEPCACPACLDGEPCLYPSPSPDRPA
jgi:hypothetical protein